MFLSVTFYVSIEVLFLTELSYTNSSLTYKMIDNTFGKNIIPENELQRLDALRKYRIMDTPSEASFENIARLATECFEVPIALVSLVDAEKVFFKANVGMGNAKEANRGKSLCALAILDPEVTVFEDALKEPCLMANPNVAGNFGLRFYAGAPLITADGFMIGTLCIIDKKPRVFSARERGMLQRFATAVMDQIELRLGVMAERHYYEDETLVQAALSEELQAMNEEMRATNEELAISRDRLGQANSNLEQILNMLPASVVVIRGYDLTVEMINNSNLQYWKKSKEEVLGKPFLEILPDLADQPFAGQLRKVMETGEIIDVKESPVLFAAADGSIRETFVDYTYQPLSDQDGNRTGVLVMSFEITDRVVSRRLLQQYADDLAMANAQLLASNNELLRSESRFKYLIQEAPVAIGVLHGKDLLIESANAKILEVWGKNESVIGLKLLEALPEIKGQPFEDILANVFETGQAFYANEIRAMLEHNGKLRELFFNLVYQPIEDASGSVSDILVVAVDVTQLVYSRKQVEQAEQTTRLAIEAANVATWNVHAETQALIASPRLNELFGFFPDEEITVDRIMAQIDEEYRDSVAKGIKNTISLGGNYDISYLVTGFRDKKRRWLRSLGNLSPDLSGEFSAFTGVTMDITDMKQDELRKNDFIGMVSHELKTPLTSLNGHLQFLQRKAEKGGEVVATAFDQPLKQVRQMTTMINGFLNVSRLDSGKIHIEKTEFNMNELLTEILEEHLSLNTGHKLTIDAQNIPIITADRAKIGQVINNLVSNAAKYSPFDSKIIIYGEVKDGNVKISVSDEGIGIREADLNRLFERYYRVENNNNVSGFGIGLYLSAEIIQHHNGKIWAESELGKGSKFFFEVPVGCVKV